MRLCWFPYSTVRAEKLEKIIKPAAKSRRDLYMLGGDMLSAFQKKVEVEVEVERIAY